MSTKQNNLKKLIKNVVKEEIDSQLNEARLIYLKQLAKDIVNQYFPVTGGVGPTMYTDGKQQNRFRAELEMQIAGAIKGVIRRHNRGQYIVKD